MPPTINPYLWPLSEQDMQRPDIVEQIINSFQRPYDPAAQGYDPRYIQDLSTRPVVDWTPPNVPVQQEIQDLQPTQTFEPSNGAINRMPPIQNAQVAPTIQPVQQPSTGQSKSASAMPEGYEEYLKIFQNTLGAAPELDKKRRNQLAMVAGINALGQALKQVVDFHGRSKHGAPITPQQDQVTPTLLSMYDKEMQDYLARKSKYDLQKTQSMQDAFRYAYGDKQQQEAFDRQLEILGKEQGFRSGEAEKQRGFESGEADKERGWRSGETSAQRGFQTQEREGEQGDILERMKKQFDYDMALEKERAKSRGVSGGSGKMMEGIGDGWEVIDQATGNTVSIPKVMFWDVLTRELKEMNMTSDEFSNPDRLPSKGYGSTDEEAKAIVTGAWNKYYQPVYDEQGKQVGWGIKQSQNQGNKEYPTFWDFMPEAVPGANEPSWFKK